MALPPLLFQPVLKRIRWGGRKLGTALGKAIGEESDYAESWEIADHADGMSVVSEGPLAGTTLPDIVSRCPEELLGSRSTTQQFPLLIKFLDANDWLSLQVHPNDVLARSYNAAENGKTEAWVILDATPESRICAGLRAGVTSEQLRSAVLHGNAEELLNIIPVAPGDCVFVPAGTVHALGPGIVLAEVQQQSNLTFRLHDWGRVDASGKPRPVHLEESLKCTDFARGPVTTCSPERRTENEHEFEQLVKCSYFEIRRHQTSRDFRLSDRDGFRILMMLTGAARVNTSTGAVALQRGTTVLIPACSRAIEVCPENLIQMLEIYGPEY